MIRCLLAVIGLAWSLATPAVEQTLTLGVHAYRAPHLMTARYQPLADYLSAQLPGITIDLQVLALDELERRLQDHRIDLVLTNPRHFMSLRSANSLTGAVATMVKRSADGATTRSLGGVIFALAGRDDIRNLADLQPLRIAIPNQRHLGGFLAPQFEIYDAGAQLPQPRRFMAVGNHDQVVERVLAGKADVGFVRTEVLEDLVAQGRLVMADIKIINAQRLGDFPFASSTRLYPEWPFIALPHVDERTVARITAALLLTGPSDPGTRGMPGFVPPADYRPVERALRALRLSPFDHIPAFTLRDVWRSHSGVVSAAAVAIAAILALSLLLVTRNRALLASSLALTDSAARMGGMHEMQRLVARSTAQLLDASAAEKDQAIDHMLEVTARHLHADRGYLFLISGDRQSFDNTHEWCAPGVSAQLDFNQDLPMDAMPWWWEQLARHRALVIDDVNALPHETGGVQAHLIEQGIQSLFALSLKKNNVTYGFIGFDAVRAQRAWSSEEILPLETMTEALSNALARWDAEDNLQEKSDLLETLFESVPMPLFYKDRDGIYRGVNRAFETFFGAQRTHLVGKSVFDISPPDLARIYYDKDQELFANGGLQEYESQVRSADGGLRDVLFSKTLYGDGRGRVAGLIGAVADITERNLQERLLRLTARRDEALLQLPRLAEELEETAFLQHGMEIAEELTGSNIAFIHFINDDDRSIELVAWSRRTKVDHCDAVSDRHYPVEQAGAWADALRRQAPVVFNDYSNDTNAMGLSEGHAELRRLVSLPVVENGRVVMLTGVGNKATDYDPLDVETLQLVSNEIWRLVQRRRSLEKLELSASVFSHALEGILITDPAGGIVDVNDAFVAITGYARDEVIGRNPRMLKSGRQDDEFYAQMWHALLRDGHWSGEIWNRRRDGGDYPQVLTISAVYKQNGEVRHYVALMSDISEQKQYQSQLEHIAHFDALTNLPNRVLLGDRIRQAMLQSKRREQILAVAYLDLDGFKAVNDMHGHGVGDQLLTTIASRMRLMLREGDTISRLGGDEFVIVLPDLKNRESVVPELGRLLEAASQVFRIDNVSVSVSASIGVTFYPQDEDVDADLLLRQADQAMYQAKLAGRNRYHVFDNEQYRNLRGTSEIIERMSQGLVDGEFIFHYQPKVNMRTGEVVGAEALIRWDHPEQGLLAPAHFLHFVDGKPMMVAFGQLAIRSSLQQLEQWRSAGLKIPISVNVDGFHLQQPDFVAWLSRELQNHPALPADSLILEVLETSALADLAVVSRVIAGCREIGVEFSLDDFGTGYSSLTYLKSLPASELKIDRSFVRDCLEDPEDLAILEGVLGLATAFQRGVVAEGVETLAHGQMLLRLGCELAQGYAIARPMPAGDLVDWTGRWQVEAVWRETLPIGREDFPVLFAGVEHRAWVSRIEACLQEEGPAPVLDVHECRFGHWLDGAGRMRYAGVAQFEVIQPLHADAHALAAELIELRAIGQRMQAVARLNELHDLRDQLIKRLYGLLQLTGHRNAP